MTFEKFSPCHVLAMHYSSMPKAAQTDSIDIQTILSKKSGPTFDAMQLYFLMIPSAQIEHEQKCIRGGFQMTHAFMAVDAN